MKEFFETYPLLAWSVVSTLCAAVVITVLWEKVKWWWFNTWVNFPLIGRIAILARDNNPDSSNAGWFSAERTLCQEYKNFVHIQDEHDFNEKIKYLTRAGDNGRSPTPAWIWLLTVAMVFVEALGFSYVLAGYTIPGASENLQQTGAYGIAFLISVILVAFTHFTGHELYRSSLIKNARASWVANNRAGDLDGTVPLAAPQSIDDGQPGYVQLCNRVGAHPSYLLAKATVLIVLVIAGFATYVRGQVLEKELTSRVALATQQIDQGSRPAADSMDMSAASVKLPDADAASNDSADKKAVADEASIDRHGGWATFIILAFIFVFLQILGVLFGYRWGFAGRQSAQAYRDTGSGRYSSYAAVREHYRRIADTAQSRLAVLQQRIMANNSKRGTSAAHLKKTFRDYMQESRLQDEADRMNERRHAQAVAEQTSTPIAAPVAAPAATAPAPAPAPAPASASAPAPAPASTAPEAAAAPAAPEIAEILARLDALGEDKQAKLALLDTLPSDVHQSVVAALRQKRADDERKARNAELEGLL